MHQFLEHPMGRILAAFEGGEGEIADLPHRRWLFGKAQHLSFINRRQIRFCFIRLRALPVADLQHLFAALATPLAEHVVEDEIQILRNLRLAMHLLVFIGTQAHHPSDERGRRCKVIRREWKLVRVEAVDC